MNFSQWLDKFVNEKELDVEGVVFEVEGESGLNVIPLSVVIDAVKGSTKVDKGQIRRLLIQKDSINVLHFFQFLAKRLAV